MKKVVHRDIKLDNILIKQIEDKENYEVRVADFGLATFTLKDEMIEHKCGSPGYVAPEIFKKSGYSYKADIFSLGSVCFNLLTGRYLFSADNQQDLLIKNIKCQTAHIVKYLQNTTPECRDLLFKMIEIDPIKRLSAKEALMHDWFKIDKGVIIKLLQENKIMCLPQEKASNMNVIRAHPFQIGPYATDNSNQNYKYIINSF